MAAVTSFLDPGTPAVAAMPPDPIAGRPIAGLSTGKRPADMSPCLSVGHRSPSTWSGAQASDEAQQLDSPDEDASMGHDAGSPSGGASGPRLDQCGGASGARLDQCRSDDADQMDCQSREGGPPSTPTQLSPFAVPVSSPSPPSPCLFPLQSLPDELLVQCLARVPGSLAGPGCILLRGVCQRWRRLINSAAFLDLRENVEASQEWLVTLTWRIAGGLLCKIFDPLTNKCQRVQCSLNALPPERQHFGTVAGGREIFLIGGEVSTNEMETYESQVTVLDKVEAYDCVLNCTRQLAPMPGGGRTRFACCAGEGRIFVLGGVGPSEKPVLTSLVYDVACDRWAETTPLPCPRVSGQAVWHEGRVILLGGTAEAGETASALLSVESFNPSTLAWTPMPQVPVPRSNFKAAVVAGRLCIVGGERPLAFEDQGAFGEADQGFMDDGMTGETACFNEPLVFDAAAKAWKVFRRASGYKELRSIAGVEDRLHCQHAACASFQSRSFAVVSLYDEFFLVRRCAQGTSSYCRHIHRFSPLLVPRGMGTAWECINRRQAYSSLLREAGDCWDHSVVLVIKC